MAVRFVPSRCEGVSGVDAVTVHPDALELHIGAGRTVHRFADLAGRPTGLRAAVDWLARTPRTIGERAWFHPPAERFFRFDTTPPITLFMPASDTEQGETWRAIRAVLQAGGYATRDLG